MRKKKRPDELFAEILKNDSVSPPEPSKTLPIPKSGERYSKDGDATNRQIVMDALGDRYEIESTIAKGPLGFIYKVRDTALNRIVAVRNVRLDMAAPEIQDKIKKRVLREASVASLLSHPAIVAIHDIISTPHASIVLMEFVEGVSLKSILETKKRLSLEQTTRILKQVAAALDHAHQHRVIHRDIKPASIVVTFDNDVRVMDFGIAKIESGNTVGGTILGTPDYMSPEQAKGETIDGRSDLFSLGCVLFECLVGEKPFKSESVNGMLLRIVSEDPPPIPWKELGHPGALEQVMAKALAKNPDARYQTGAALVEVLDQLLIGEDEEVTVEIARESEPASTESDEQVEFNTEPEFDSTKDDESVEIIEEPELEVTQDQEPELGFTQGDELVEMNVEQELEFTQGDEVKRTNEAFATLSKEDETRQAPLPTPAAEAQTPIDEDDQTESQLDQQQATDLYARAEKAYAAGDFWEAIQLCRYAVDASPKDSRFHYLLGLALSENAHWKRDAEESLKTALRIDPQNPEYVNALADFFEKQGRTEEAKEMYDRAKTIQ